MGRNPPFAGIHNAGARRRRGRRVERLVGRTEPAAPRLKRLRCGRTLHVSRNVRGPTKITPASKPLPVIDSNVTPCPIVFGVPPPPFSSQIIFGLGDSDPSSAGDHKGFPPSELGPSSSGIHVGSTGPPPVPSGSG